MYSALDKERMMIPIKANPGRSAYRKKDEAVEWSGEIPWKTECERLPCPWTNAREQVCKAVGISRSLKQQASHCIELQKRCCRSVQFFLLPAYRHEDESGCIAAIF